MLTKETDAESPLSESDPQFVETLLSHINKHLIAGTPERISDDDLMSLVHAYRVQFENYVVAQREKPDRKPREKKQSIAEFILKF